MSYRGDDLTPLLLQAPGPGVGFRQGVVTAWDPLTAANTIEVAGATMSDLPILNTSEALLLAPGDVVGILTAGASWFITGRITVPGTPAAASALAMVSSRIRVAQVLGTVPTSSTTYQALAGPVVADVLIGSSGKALVMVGAAVNYGTTNNLNTEGGEVGVAVSGATSLSANASNSAQEALNLNSTSTVLGHLNRSILLENLNPGLHTFEHQVRAFTAGRTCNFDRRSLVIFAL